MLKPFKSLYFNEQIRSKRRELNYTQMQLALKAGVGVDLIKTLERGTHLNITMDNLRRISKALEFDEWNLALLGTQL